MKKGKRILLIFAVALMTSFMISIAVLAGETYNPTSNYISSTGYFNAGQSAVLSCPSMVDEYDGTYDIYLESFVFDGFPLNAMPYVGSLYLRAYTYPQPVNAVGTIASFSSTGGGYSYNYNPGYGALGEAICLKASSRVFWGCTVTVRWYV